MDYILAHDLGTSGNKATLYSKTGTLIKSITAAYPTHFFNDNWAEQNPDDWWSAVCSSSKRLLEDIDPSDVSVISFSGQMMGCVCLDENLRVLHPSILYCDSRSQEENAKLADKIGAFRFYEITGQRAAPTLTLPKLMWLRKHKPEIFNRTKVVLNTKDYIIFKLTGALVTDYSDASGTGLFDINSLSWSEEISEASGIDCSLMPNAVSSIKVVGKVHAKAAEESGVAEGTLVVAGAADGCSAGVGALAVKPGQAYTSLGSSAWTAVVTEKPVIDREMRTVTFPHAVPGLYQPCGAMTSGGTALNWAKEVFCRFEISEAEKLGKNPYSLIDEAAKSSAPGSNGVLFLPYILGERAPLWDADAKGCFLGLKQSNTHADIMRSVMEGVAFNLLSVYNSLKENVDITSMVIVGGGAKGEIWRKIIADEFGIKVAKPANIESCASMGAAIIGGVGAGLIRDFDQLGEILTAEDIVEADLEIKGFYDKRHALFEDSYKALKNLMRDY